MLILLYIITFQTTGSSPGTRTLSRNLSLLQGPGSKLSYFDIILPPKTPWSGVVRLDVNGMTYRYSSIDRRFFFSRSPISTASLSHWHWQTVKASKGLQFVYKKMKRCSCNLFYFSVKYFDIYIYDTYDVEKQAFVTNVALLFAVG